MADQLQFTINRAVDANGDPAPGAKAYFYQSGTNTLRTVYTTDDASVAHPSPLVADSEGVFPAVFANGACKVLITDASDVTLTGYPMDPVFLVPTASAGASRITFTPTVEIPATNVQAAIEQVQENIVAPLADLGLGVTGSAPLLANLDATNTASGFYRFDGTTTGTFPAAVTASDGGLIILWRETSGEGVMVIIPRGNNVAHYTRTLTASAWGSWAANVISDATWAAGTDTGPAMISPAQLETKIRLGYDSGPTAISTAAEMTFAHGLGGIPLIFSVGLICTTADLGYSVGDYVPLYPNSSTSGDTETNPIWATATDIGIRFFSTPKISHKTSTASVQNINGGSWSVVVRARK